MARHDDDAEDDRPRSRGRDDDDADAGDEDRPRKKRRRDDDDYDSERRKRRGGSGGGGGKVVLIVLAIAGGLLLVCGVGGVFLILPAVSKVREAAARTNEINNMKQISLGMLAHSDRTSKLPAADQNLAWRVHVLPFIEQDSVYRQFELNRAWNQGKNQSLADTQIKTYQSVLDDPPTPQTHYRVFLGDGSAFDPNLMRRAQFPTYIQDGMSNTILMIDTAESVPWPAPKEVVLQPGGQFPDFGHAKRNHILIAMCDGSVRALEKKQMDAAKIRALATATGGEAVGDW